MIIFLKFENQSSTPDDARASQAASTNRFLLTWSAASFQCPEGTCAEDMGD
jgi:hypothetical protein